MSGGGARRAALPYVLILGLTLLLVAAPHFVSMPIPHGSVAVTDASFSIDGGPEEVVELPHRWPRTLGAGPAYGTYRFTVALPSSGPSYLLVPAAQHTLVARLDGRRLAGTDMQPWGERSVGAAYMLPLPPGDGGPARLELVLTREGGFVPGYLSQMHVAEESAMAGVRWLWSFVTSGSRVAVIGLQALVVLGIATVWFARPHDPIFAWLFLIGIGSMAYTLAIPFSTRPAAADDQIYLLLALSSFGLTAAGLSLAIVGIPRPAWLKASVVALPLALIACVELAILPPMICIMISSFVAIGGHVAAAGLLARDSLRVGEWDRALLAVPFFVTSWYGLRDLGVVVGLVDGALLIGAKIRPVTVVAVLILLMRRLASSLDALDRSNETLRQKLKAQEDELSTLHAKERALTAQSVREDERGRLMRDLHDGLSGHLVSIIALAQAQTARPEAIEKAARGALDDLRLVVNSLDLDDGDLLPALAGLRERLEPQMRRLGVEFGWSMERLPQVSGVSPGNALSILRILQEAITNALKHGGARRISVEGSAGADGSAVLQVRNDIAREPVRGQGHGLRNMQRRAQELGGSVRLDIGDDRALLTVVLPPHLHE